MKKLVTVLFLLITILGSGQSVIAPDSKVFLENTANQDASGFGVTGFNATDVLLASISLVTFPTGTTFYLGTTTGLTAASGFTLTGNKTRLVVTGTMANINTALLSLKVNTGTVKGEIKVSVAATVNPTGYFYNGVNGHFYRPVATGNTYTGARTAAEATTFKGQTGYLLTLTSADENTFVFNNVPQSNIWFACTDEVVEGRWRIDAGPEKGTLIKTFNGQLTGNIVGQYNNWAGGEPNNSGGNLLQTTNLLLHYNTSDIDSYFGTGTIIKDITPNNLHGTIVGSPSYLNQNSYRELIWNTNAYIASPDLDSILTGDRPTHSVEVWAYPTANGVIVQYTGQATPNTSYHFSGIELVNGRPVFGMWGPNGLVTTGTSANAITLNEWHQFILTYDGTFVRGYVDGALVATTSSVNFVTPAELGQTSELRLIFGARTGTNHGDGTSFDGRFNIMRVYNKALTASEIVANYNSVASTAGEDYAVTKWGGAATWNDLPGTAQWVNPYVIEYGTWTNPDNATFTEFYSNSTSYSNGQIQRLQFNLNFGTGIDKTKFSGKMYTTSNNILTQATAAGFTPVTGVGKLDLTSDIDTNRVSGNLKNHVLSLATSYTQTELVTLYSNLVTLPDVYLAFKEFNNKGILGDQSGLEFKKGIQFINADVNRNGIIDESDCYQLLQQLTGIRSLVQNNNLDNFIRVTPKSTYDTITLNNWKSFNLNSKMPVNITPNVLNSIDVAVSWLGDIDLAQSTPQTVQAVAASSIRSFSVTSNEIQASIITEIVNDTVYATINLDPLTQVLTGTQFKLNYDNEVLKYVKTDFKTLDNIINFGVDKGTYINLGSLITNGNGGLDNKTEYKITFIPKTKISNILGLISITMTDAVNQAGGQLKVKVL
jgi:hypothetical protein